MKAFVTKVKNETGQDIMKGGIWSDSLLSDQIAKYVITNFMNIENLPTSVVLGGDKGAQGKKGQGQGQAQAIVQPTQSQTQPPTQEPAPVQAAPAPQGTQTPPAQAPSPQQTAAQIPAKETAV